MSGIVADRVSKMWTASAGLRPIDLRVRPGELVAIRGRSGSGKSTLLAVLAGLCAPDTGSIEVDGGHPDPSLAWSTLALVPQVLALSIELTVAENVAEGRRGNHRGSAARAVSDVLGELDLAAEADRPIDQVSMGQQQRAAVARAVIAHPRVLLGDEPTSFQDADHAAVVVGAFRTRAAAGAAVLLVTHDPLVADAADRVVELTTGYKY